MANTEEQNQALVQFAKTLKWEDYIKDSIVADSLIKIRNHINTRKGSNAEASPQAKEDIDLSTAKRVKLVVVGDGAVGKTSLILSYTTNKFPNEDNMQLYETHVVDEVIDSKNVKINIHDTAGEEDFNTLRPRTYDKADVFLVCYSISSKQSFKSVKNKWIPEIRTHSTAPIVIIGCKSDLRSNTDVKERLQTMGLQFVSTIEGEKLANKLDCTYTECSAINSDNVKETFIKAVRDTWVKRLVAFNEKITVSVIAKKRRSTIYNINKTNKCIVM